MERVSNVGSDMTMPNCLNPMRQVIQAAQSVMMRVAQLMRSVRMRLRCQRSHRHGCHGGGGSTSPGRLRRSQAVRPASSRSPPPACIASGHATRQRHHGSPERCLGDGRYCARGLGHGHASCRTKSTGGAAVTQSSICSRCASPFRGKGRCALRSPCPLPARLRVR